jgi:hypothetical protein
MKLCQGQIWKQGKGFIRIVRLERLEVEYKSLADLHSKEGTNHVTSKKDFCRLLKEARLLAPAKPAKSIPPRVEGVKKSQTVACRRT